MTIRIPVDHGEWNYTTQERTCGDCYACCVWLGVEELKKHTGQTCKHLCGTNDPTKRCSIYDRRPTACAEYKCVWREGWGADNMRPNISGILVTGYNSERNPGMGSFTVNVIDKKKAGNCDKDVIAALLALAITDEVRLVLIEEKRALLFRDGVIYSCKLLSPDGYESLRFEASDKPVGQYRTE